MPDIIAYDFLASTPAVNGFAGELGSKFAVASSISVTKFGAFLPGGGSWAGPKTVNLWDSTGTLLHSETFGAAGNTVTDGQVLKTLATPIALSPGTYTISANGYGGPDLTNYSDTTSPNPYITFNDGTGAISAIAGGVLNTTANAYPTTDAGSSVSPAIFVAATFAYQTVGATPTVNVVFHGDSLTFGYNGTGAGTSSATRLATVKAGLGPLALITNKGTSGHTLAQLISELPTINSLYIPGLSNVLVVQGGHNDYNGGATSAQVIASIKSYVAGALAGHSDWLIVWATELPAAYPGYPANFDALRNASNATTRTIWRSIGIATLSDIAVDYIMGQDGCEQNATYYSATDHAHCTDAGYTRWGQYDLAAIQLVIGSGGRKTYLVPVTI